MHERQAIREAIASQLKGPGPTYRTAAGTRVFESRHAPIRTAELPCISVYTDSESVDEASWATAPRELSRSLVVAIDAWVVAGSNVDDAMDAIALEIETAMDLDLNLNGTAFSSGLSSTEFGIKEDGHKPLGCVHLEYSVTYHTDLRVVNEVDDFDILSVEYNLEGDQATLDAAHDLLTGVHE